MRKPSPARYRTTHWSSYTSSLCRRGSLLIWLDKEMIWLAPPDGRPGRPAVFSDVAIQFCLTIKALFKLPLRQTTGMVASLLKLADLDWAVPDYTTLCKRQKTLAAQISYPYTRGLLASVPDFRSESATGTKEIPGIPPNQAQLMPGCRFADRCDRVLPACHSHRPRLQSIATGEVPHRVACPVVIVAEGIATHD